MTTAAPARLRRPAAAAGYCDQFGRLGSRARAAAPRYWLDRAGTTRPGCGGDLAGHRRGGLADSFGDRGHALGIGQPVGDGKPILNDKYRLLITGGSARWPWSLGRCTAPGPAPYRITTPVRADPRDADLADTVTHQSRAVHMDPHLPGRPRDADQPGIEQFEEPRLSLQYATGRRSSSARPCSAIPPGGYGKCHWSSQPD